MRDFKCSKFRLTLLALTLYLFPILIEMIDTNKLFIDLVTEKLSPTLVMIPIFILAFCAEAEKVYFDTKTLIIEGKMKQLSDISSIKKHFWISQKITFTDGITLKYYPILYPKALLLKFETLAQDGLYTQPKNLTTDITKYHFCTQCSKIIIILAMLFMLGAGISFVSSISVHPILVAISFFSMFSFLAIIIMFWETDNKFIGADGILIFNQQRTQLEKVYFHQIESHKKGLFKIIIFKRDNKEDIRIFLPFYPQNIQTFLHEKIRKIPKSTAWF